MNSVTKRIKDRGDLRIDFGIVSPDVAHWENDVFRKASWPIDPDSLCVRAQVAAASQAIPAAAASYMPFPADQLSDSIIGNVRPDRNDFANEFVPDNKRHGYRFLCPIVPLIDMEIRATDPGEKHANLHIVDAEFRFRHVIEP